jgi:hypothetical protein
MVGNTPRCVWINTARVINFHNKTSRCILDRRELCSRRGSKCVCICVRDKSFSALKVWCGAEFFPQDALGSLWFPYTCMAVYRISRRISLNFEKIELETWYLGVCARRECVRPADLLGWERRRRQKRKGDTFLATPFRLFSLRAGKQKSPGKFLETPQKDKIEINSAFVHKAFGSLFKSLHSNNFSVCQGLSPIVRFSNE